MNSQHSMPAERWLQWNIGVLTAYGTMLLGMGQGDPTLPTLSVFVAISSIIFTDQLRWFRLPRTLGNLAALAALAVCVLDFFQDRERQLLAIAHLLVYLQIILLYQQKSPRVYWQLIVLSLLQVVVAAALNEHINFGILLVGYLFCSLMAISRLFVLRESLKAARAGTTVVGPQYAALRRSEASTDAGSYIRPLAPQSQAEQAAAQQTSRNMLGWSWAGDLAVFSCGTLVAAFLFFFMTPRMGGTPWEADAGGASVGFNPNDVSLADLSQIQQGETVVMRIKLIDTETEQPIEFDGDLFLRGAVKSKYEGSGRWSNSRTSESRKPVDLPALAADRPRVRQEITLEPTSHNYLFHVAPAYRSDYNATSIDIHPHALELQRAEWRQGEMRYTVATDGFDGSRQREIVPQYVWFDRRSQMISFQRIREQEMLEFSAAANPEAARIAAEEAARLGADAANRYAVAKALEAYFVEPGRFEYTLNPQVARVAAGRDPVEVFLTEVRAGHCEYFASSLALMLRSQGIPSRLVIGYSGGEFNAVGDYYVVKEKFAHAWVEAYLEPGDIPPGALPPGTDTRYGAWLRLNPTPASIASAEIEQTMWTRISETLDYVEMMWREYVLNLDAERQFEKIYQPLAVRVRTLFTNLTDQQAWNAAIVNAAGLVGLDIHGPLRRISWFHWPAGLVVVSLGLVGLVLMQFGRTVRRKIAPPDDAPLPRAKPPAFYDRFERLARRHGLTRGEGETPQELAQRMRALLASSEESAPAAGLPDAVVAALYQVRFSGRPLDKPEAEAIESALVGLNEALRERTRTTG